MSVFESIQLLLLAAVVLLQLARRLQLPYPAMLALAGVVVAMIPGAPTVSFNPQTALALFIAPVLLDAAYDFPLGAVRQLWRPLIALAVVAVLLTTAVVAFIGWHYAGLPLAAAIALGAIVAPPDAAAATAVMTSLAVPRSSAIVLTGESLFNDATALLLFSGALSVQAGGGLDGRVALHLALAVPGGIALGIAGALLMDRLGRFVEGTLGGNLLQFVNTFVIWLLAERLELSAVLAVVAMAMTIAHRNRDTNPRVRVHSFAVWASVVFVLNVLAFLMMGMQARTILGHLPPGQLWPALHFAGLVVAAVIGVRLTAVIALNRLRARSGEAGRPSLAQGVLVGWSGMRGLVTLATAFALPANFPQRDLITLAAFSVVLATLVFQGLTLRPLIHLLKLDRSDDQMRSLHAARRALAMAALHRLEGETGEEAAHLRQRYVKVGDAAADVEGDKPFFRYRALSLGTVRAERARLAQLRTDDAIDTATFYQLQEELDWRELSLLPDDERRIEES